MKYIRYLMILILILEILLFIAKYTLNYNYGIYFNYLQIFCCIVMTIHLIYLMLFK